MIVSLPATAPGLGVLKLASRGLTGDVLIHVANLSIARAGMVRKLRAAAQINPLGNNALSMGDLTAGRFGALCTLSYRWRWAKGLQFLLENLRGDENE